MLKIWLLKATFLLFDFCMIWLLSSRDSVSVSHCYEIQNPFRSWVRVIKMSRNTNLKTQLDISRKKNLLPLSWYFSEQNDLFFNKGSQTVARDWRTSVTLRTWNKVSRNTSCTLIKKRFINFSQSKQYLIAALFFWHILQLISFPSLLRLMARRLNKLLCRKLLGRLSKRFSSGMPICARHFRNR